MSLIRVYWHFNCWRSVLNQQNLNMLGAGELKRYICHFLCLGIPLPRPQGKPAQSVRVNSQAISLFCQLCNACLRCILLSVPTTYLQLTLTFIWRTAFFFLSSTDCCYCCCFLLVSVENKTSITIFQAHRIIASSPSSVSFPHNMLLIFLT